MNPLIKKYCDIVLVDNDSRIPLELEGIEAQSLDSQSLSGLLKQLEDFVKEKYVVVVTNSDRIAKQVSLVNEELSERYICLINNGQVDADLAIKEYQRLEMQVVDSVGRTFTLGEELAQNVYPTSDGRVIYKTNADPSSFKKEVTAVSLKTSQQLFGFLLPDSYRVDKFKYSLDGYTFSTVEESLKLLKKVLETCNGDAIPDDILFFNGEFYIINPVIEIPTIGARKNFVYKVLTGRELVSGKELEGLMEAFLSADTVLPAYLLSFFEEEFTTNQVFSKELYSYVLARYFL